MGTIRINDGIPHRELRVLSADGALLGVMPTKEAMKLAAEQGLSLVEVNPKASPPVCRIMRWSGRTPSGPPDESA